MPAIAVDVVFCAITVVPKSAVAEIAVPLPLIDMPVLPPATTRAGPEPSSVILLGWTRSQRGYWSLFRGY